MYEFIANALAAWPDDLADCGAYVCTLSNPQALDIGTLLGGAPRESPFYKVLASEPRMLMLANRFTPIHMRLWCVYEAFLAYELGIAVRIAGEALHLLSGELAEFLRLKEGAASRMRREATEPVRAAAATLEARGGEAAAALHSLLPRVEDALEEVARAKLRVLLAEDAALVDFDKAACFDDNDRTAILADIGDRYRSAASFVAGLVRDAVCRSVGAACDDAATNFACDDADLTSPASVLDVVARLWLARQRLTHLRLRHCAVSDDGAHALRCAVQWLTRLKVRCRVVRIVLSRVRARACVSDPCSGRPVPHSTSTPT